MTQLVDWLRLIRSENIGPRTFRQLINRYGGARAALEALPDLVAKILRGRVIRLADRDEVLREIEAAHARGVRFVASVDLDYPSLLREIADAPPILALRGDASVTLWRLLARVTLRLPGWPLRNASRADYRAPIILSHLDRRAASTP